MESRLSSAFAVAVAEVFPDSVLTFAEPTVKALSCRVVPSPIDPEVVAL
jgi:hypothetical protein